MRWDCWFYVESDIVDAMPRNVQKEREAPYTREILRKLSRRITHSQRRIRNKHDLKTYILRRIR